MKVLFLDKEGGYGGSSRSLYILVKNLKVSKIIPFVMLRTKGSMLSQYRRLNIKTYVNESFPVYKPTQRKNIFVFLLFLLRINHFIKSYRYLCKIINDEKIDIIHMNHDSFFLYGLLFKYFRSIKIVIHMRTMLPLNHFARIQARCIENFASQLLFISENELNRYEKLLGRKPENYSVIYNAAEKGIYRSELSKKNVSSDEILKILYLGNLEYEKGSDRLLGIALELRKIKFKHVLFIVCGENRQKVKKGRKNSLLYKAKLNGVEKYFCFMGHQPNPDIFLEQAHMLIRTSRQNDPWGRDVIEAMIHGLPVLATGTWNKFVRHGETGYLIHPYSAFKAANLIIRLAEDPALRRSMGQAGLSAAKKLFDVNKHSNAVINIYETLINNSLNVFKSETIKK